MKQQANRVLAMVLCLVMALGCLGGAAPAVQGAAAAPENVVYATSGETAFVPAGYTYVYETETGSTYSKTVSADAYVSFEALTTQEAEALASLESGEAEYLTNPDGSTMVMRTFDAKEAAQLSGSVREILGEQPAEVDDGQQLQVISPVYTSDTQVRAMIVLEDQPVIHQPGMNVMLGQTLGTAESQAVRSLEQKQDATLASIGKELGHKLEVRSQFTILTNAVAVTVPYGELAQIRKMNGVKSAYVMPTFEAPEINAQEVTGIAPNMKYVSPGMGATAAWDCGFDGTGISVAIIDSGLFYENPAFSILPEDQEQVAFAKDDIAEILASYTLHAEEFAEDATIDNFYYNSKIPFGFGYGAMQADFGTDHASIGHGTHVAGIVAGNLPDELKKQFQMDTMGIAPEAQLVIMNVSDNTGSISFDSIIAALEDCIALGVDCANLSLGSPCGPAYIEGMSEVFDAAYEAGISVAVSAGNDGFSGEGSLWGDNMVKSTSVDTGTIGFPGSTDAPLTVASAENAAIFYVYGNKITYEVKGGIRREEPYSEMRGVPEGKGFKEQLGGQDLQYTRDPASAEGKLLFSMVEEGVEPADLVAQAVESKAAGLVLINGQTVTLTEFPLPIAAMNAFSLSFIEFNIKEGGTLRVEPFWNLNETAGEMSAFSSWGPTGSLTMKPEITGIGGNVFSSYYNSFAVSSGTSMSSPAVAASAALVRQYLNNTPVDPKDYAHVTNCLLMSTATPIVDEAHDIPYFVRRQGAGMANVGAAIASEAYIQVPGTNKAKLELGDDPARTGVYRMRFEVVNFSESDKTYTLDTTVLGQKAVGGLLKYGEVTHLTYEYARELDATVTYSAEDGQIVVPAGQTVTVTATVALTDVEKAYYDERFPCGAYVEGFIQLNSESSVNLSVPFLGFYGDFSDAPTLETGTYATQLGDDRAYQTADQVQTALWSYLPADPSMGNFSKLVKFYLGDTRAVNAAKIPYEYHESSQILDGYYPFEPLAAGISPNGDVSLDELHFEVGLTRNAANIHYTVTDRDSGQVLYEEDTGFISKTYKKSVCFEPSLEWLFPIRGYEIGTGRPKYDTTKCKLKENTWVTMRLEITPELEAGEPEVREFTLYIDNTAPFNKDDYTIRYSFEEFSGRWRAEYSKNISENWFCDYSEDYILEYSGNRDKWSGSSFRFIYYDVVPGFQKEDDWSETSTLSFSSDMQKFISTSYDYAGNIAAIVVEGGDNLLHCMDLEADATTIHTGDRVIVKNVAQLDFTPVLNWTVSDPAVAEIVEQGNDYCTIQGLQYGLVTVTAEIYGKTKSVDIMVTDADHEAAQVVADLIDGLPAPEEVTLEDTEAIAAARAAYEGLTEEQQKLVGNVDRLLACEEALEAAKDLPFTDVAKDAWYYSVVSYVYRHGIMNGMSDTLFAPEKDLTRGQLVTTLYRLAGSPEVTELSTFTDVGKDAYYTKAIAWAQDVGVATGMTDTTFAPAKAVTREQAATFLYRYVTLVLEEEPTQGRDLTDFTDGGKVHDYAKTAMAWAVAEEFFEGYGDGTLRPGAFLSRAQMAKLLTILDQNF